MPSPSSRYRWNDVAGRYIGASGRFVSYREIRSYLDAVLDNNERQVLDLANRLRAREISLQAWQIQMRDLLKDIHLASSALARGGWAQMSEADYQRAQEKIAFQYEKLSAFAQQIEKGLALDGRFLNRTKLYAQSGRSTYHQSLRNEMEIRGMKREKSVLGPADHCSECLSEAERGFVPIGELVLIGDRQCKSNCRCHVEFE